MNINSSLENPPHEIPENWIWVEIGSLSKVVSGGTPRSSIKEFYENGTIPWITPADLSKYKKVYISNGRKYITELGLAKSSAKLLPINTVLFSSRAPIGYVVIAKKELATNQGFKSFPPSSAWIPKYCYYYLKSIKNLAESMASGTTFLELSGKKAAQIPFPLPPLAEQKRIVAKLDILMGHIERSKERLAKVPALLKGFRQSVLAQAVSGKLTADWREEHGDVESADVLLERIIETKLNTANTPKEKANFEKDLKNYSLDTRNESWVIIDAKHLCYNITKGTTPKKENLRQEGKVPYLKVYNIVNNKIDFAYKPQFISSDIHINYLKRSIIYPNDVIMNIVGPPLKKVAIVTNQYPEWNINQALAIFRPTSPELLTHKYLYICLSEGSEVDKILITQGARGVVGQINISLGQCKSFKIPLPPLQEQQEIVKQVEALFAKADAIEAQYQAAMQHLETLPQAILAKAFRGELVEQDKEEEPARVLLERIQAERAALELEKKKKGKKKRSR